MSPPLATILNDLGKLFRFLQVEFHFHAIWSFDLIIEMILSFLQVLSILDTAAMTNKPRQINESKKPHVNTYSARILVLETDLMWHQTKCQEFLTYLDQKKIAIRIFQNQISNHQKGNIQLFEQVDFQQKYLDELHLSQTTYFFLLLSAIRR
jgi:hypothetical protein